MHKIQKFNLSIFKVYKIYNFACFVSMRPFQRFRRKLSILGAKINKLVIKRSCPILDIKLYPGKTFAEIGSKMFMLSIINGRNTIKRRKII